MATKHTFGRTKFKEPTMLEKIKSLKLEDLKKKRWSDLSKKQQRQIIGGGAVCLVLALLCGALTKNDAELYADNVSDFIHASANYDVQATAKTTTSAAHQLIIGQANKIKTAKSKNYSTEVESIDTKIVSQKNNSIIGTTRVNTIEKMGNADEKHFTHLFVFQGQRVGAGWKVGNVLEAEAKIKAVDAEG